MAKYIVRRPDGSTEGPLSSAELRELAYEGRLSRVDQIAQVGDSRWVPATRVGGIREILEQLGQRPPAVPTQLVEPATEAPPAAAAAPSAVPPTVPILETRDPGGGGSGGGGSGTGYERYTPVPQYPILRCVAGWIAWYGWVIIGLALGMALFLTVMLALIFFDQAPDPVQLAAIFLICMGAGIATGVAIRMAASKGSQIVGWAALVAALPLVPSLGIWFRDGAAGLASMLGSAWLAGATITAVIVGMIMIAISEFFIAHADIATNSWKRLV